MPTSGQPPQVKVEVRGDRASALRLREMGLRAEDVRPVGPAVQEVFNRAEQERFDAGGPGWPPLAAVTEQAKAALGYPPEVLIRSGDLLRSLAHEESEQNDMQPDELRFGTAVPYAPFHHYGTRHMPQRILIELTPIQQHELADLLGAYVAKGLP
jgi:phage gpG-like protein